MESQGPNTAVCPPGTQSPGSTSFPLVDGLTATPPAPFSRSSQLALFLGIALVVCLLGGLAVLDGHLSRRPLPNPETRLDLNLASGNELALLPGIGPALAGRIEQHRQEKGRFRTVEDLLEVPGIGPATLARIRDRVTVGGQPPEPAKAPLPSSLASSPFAPKARIDPNNATLAQLDTLPGIGPKLGQRILDERLRRPFASVEDLRRVKGIGPKTIEKLRPHVSIQPNVESVSTSR